MTNKTIEIRPKNLMSYTLIPNNFIDQYVANANGEFVKVYLVLLRFIGSGQYDFTLKSIADFLFMTESDVLRALKYLANTGLYSLEVDEEGVVTQIIMAGQGNASTSNAVSDTLSSSSVSYEDVHSVPQEKSVSSPEEVSSTENESAIKNIEVAKSKTMTTSSQSMESTAKPTYNAEDIARFKNQEEFGELLYMVQVYLGKTLSHHDLTTIISFHDWLGLPLDVVEFLIEYCANNNHRNLRYIEKIAIDWVENGITTLEKAKTRTETFHKSYFIIFKAYGITDRRPTPKEIKVMDKWLHTYSFDIAIIVEACERTITTINKVSFQYTDSILKSWYEKKVHTFEDIEILDKQNKESKEKNTNNTAKPTTYKKENKFNNYPQRDYDFDEFEKKALEMRLKEANEKRYGS